MAKLRNSQNVCPPEVIRFLLDLFKYNDNSKNNFSDCYYRAALVIILSFYCKHCCFTKVQLKTSG